MTQPTGPAVSHLDDLLTGYLDGELDDAARSHADQHLAGCAECRRELDELGRVKAILRGAPAVDPPFGFIERVIRDRRRRRFAPAIGAAVAGMAAVWLVVLGVVMAGPPRIEPPVGDIAAAQAGFASRGPVDAAGIAFTPADEDDVPGEFRTPPRLGDVEFVSAYRAANRVGWLALYEHDDDAGDPVAVYQQLGRYQVTGLPGGGEQTEIDGSRAWWSDDVHGHNAVVVQRGWMVYTIVGDVDVDELVEVAGDLPERDEPEPPGWGERLNDAFDRFLDGFSLGV
jgi:hypothetical protein